MTEEASESRVRDTLLKAVRKLPGIDAIGHSCEYLIGAFVASLIIRNLTCLLQKLWLYESEVRRERDTDKPDEINCHFYLHAALLVEMFRQRNLLLEEAAEHDPDLAASLDRIARLLEGFLDGLRDTRLPVGQTLSAHLESQTKALIKDLKIVKGTLVKWRDQYLKRMADGT